MKMLQPCRYSDNPSSNPIEVNNFSVKLLLKNQNKEKYAGIASFTKTLFFLLLFMTLVPR